MYQQRVQSISLEGNWRLIFLPLIIALIVLAVFPSVFTFVFQGFTTETSEYLVTAPTALAMVASLILGCMLMIYASKLSWQQLGFERRNWLRNSVVGVAVGTGLLILVAMFTWLLGGVTITYSLTLAGLWPIVVAVVFFAAQGTWEEVVYRGYLMPHLSKAWGDVASIVVTSLLFAAFHGLNPGLTVMPIVNLVVYGFVFALLYYRTGNMWFTGLLHSAWNFCQGYLFGTEVSGNAVQASVFDSTPIPGRDLISGALFGFEGSIITSIFGLVLIALLTIFRQKIKTLLPGL